MSGKTLLTLGAWLNFGIALLHAIIISRAYRRVALFHWHSAAME